MKQRLQLWMLLACLLCLASFASAQLPNLSQISASNAQQVSDAQNTDDNTSATSAATTARQTGAQTTGTGTGTTGATQTGTNTQTNTGTATRTGTTSAATLTTGSTSGTGTSSGTFPTVVTPSATNANRLSGAPTLQGVGIPTMVVPYTADAPYMQKSNLPEGTVFIAVGAVLAFLGLCVIAWRALVAWSINRSVKRAALASIMASETKNPGGWASNPFKPAGGFYHQAPGGSTHDLSDKSERYASRVGARPVVPSNGSGLFFSPTASNATTNIPMTGLPPSAPGNRSSSFLPAGYYASPTAQIGQNHSQSTLNGGAQGSPGLGPRRASLGRPASHLQLAPSSREGQRLPSAQRPNGGYGGNSVTPQVSNGSLQVGAGGDDQPRAPSAYLEDLFGGHGVPGAGPQGQR